MRPCTLFLVLVIPTLCVATPVRYLLPQTSILILDNCDDQFRGKEKYADNLTLMDSTGKLTFRLSGFNNAETIGSSRMIASDLSRKCIWVIENATHRVRRFDLAGKETVTIPDVHGSAIAVDPHTGNVWALAGDGTIHNGKVLVFDEKGKNVATYEISGFDIVYDKRARAFWIAGRRLTKVGAAKGDVLFSAEISTWCASSVDVDPKSGAAWVAVRQHPQVGGSRNQLLKFDANGNRLVAIDLEGKSPFRISVNPIDGSLWAAIMRKSVERYSTDGKIMAEYPIAAIALQVDPATGDVWLVTSDDVQKMNSKGEITKRASHAQRTSQAWIAQLE